MSYLLYDSNCTVDLLSDSYNKSTNITFTGTGNYSQCQLLVGGAMDFSSCIIDDTSCMGGAYHTPNVTGDFLVRCSITLWTIGYCYCRGSQHSTTQDSTSTLLTLTAPPWHTLSQILKNIVAIMEQLMRSVQYTVLRSYDIFTHYLTRSGHIVSMVVMWCMC